MKVTLNKAADYITTFIKANIPVNLIGSPGVGKSDVIKQVAASMNLKVIDFRLSTADPTDLTGLPFIKEGRSVFLPNEAFPIETDKVPEGFNGWLLFLDEITNAPMAVQAAAYKLILDREVGIHNLHPNVKIVSAGNQINDGAAVTGEMSTALKSRMAHINIEVSVEAWQDWALANGVHHSITSFIKFKPSSIYQFDPTLDVDTFPCPRTWGMVNNLIQTVGMNDANLQNLVSAVISDGPAVEFINYCKNFVGLPTYADIVADPLGTKMPEGMSTLYALSGSIGAQTEMATIDKVMQYVSRMPAEFQLRTFNDFTKRNPLLVTVPAVREWLMANAKKMVRD